MARALRGRISCGEIVTIRYVSASARVVVVSIQDRRVMGIIIGTFREGTQARFVSLDDIIRSSVRSRFCTVIVRVFSRYLRFRSFIIVFREEAMTYV